MRGDKITGLMGRAALVILIQLPALPALLGDTLELSGTNLIVTGKVEFRQSTFYVALDGGKKAAYPESAVRQVRFDDEKASRKAPVFKGPLKRDLIHWKAALIGGETKVGSLEGIDDQTVKLSGQTLQRANILSLTVAEK